MRLNAKSVLIIKIGKDYRMIKNVPDKIPTSVVNNFHVGSHDALDDDLLEKCFWNVAPISEFLNSRADILYGNKGSGKSSVFRLLDEEIIKFSNPKKYEQLMIPICEEMEYLVIKERADKYVQTVLLKDELKYRFLWEAYILYRLAVRIHDLSYLTAELKAQLVEFINIFSRNDNRPTIMEFLSNSKFKASFRFGAENIQFGVPEFTMEPGSTETAESKEATINLDRIKSTLNQVLAENDTVAYVLIDNIDEFCEQEAYDVQKDLIDGLLQATKSYRRTPQIKLKIFIRTEQYQKVNHRKLGGKDKSGPRAVELSWGNADIRGLIANRLMFNVEQALGGPNEISIEVYEEDLYSEERKTWVRKLIQSIARIFYRTQRRSYKSRSTSISDKIAQEVITLLFPREIDHYQVDGTIQSESIFTWVSRHFALANNQIVPRTIIVFLENIVRCAIQEYGANKDIEFVKKNEFNEFPLITREMVRKAYSETQVHVVEGVHTSALNEVWEQKLRSVFPVAGTAAVIKASEIRDRAEISDFESLKEFCAYCKHVGALSQIAGSLNDTDSDAEFRVPILMQYNWWRRNNELY